MRPHQPPSRKSAATAAPRRRGAQPGNNNARKHGLHARRRPHRLARLRPRLASLQAASRLPGPPGHALAAARRLGNSLPSPGTYTEFGLFDAASELQAAVLAVSLRLHLRAAQQAADRRLVKRAAMGPLAYIRIGFYLRGIFRDADSFFPPARISTQKASPSERRPRAPTDLTDQQWAVLAPLIPPPPSADAPVGEPPLIIAASRLRFVDRVPASAAARASHGKARLRLSRQTDPARSPARAIDEICDTRPLGRPRTSPRLLLDGIFWRLATGCRWRDLPPRFPPWRQCQKVHSHLFRSGRLYTILLALHYDLRRRGRFSPASLVSRRLVLIDRRGRLVLARDAQVDWRVFTALLLMQQALSSFQAYRRHRSQGLRLHVPSAPGRLARLGTHAPDPHAEVSASPAAGTTG